MVWSSELDLTPRAEGLMEAAQSSAATRGQRHMGTEHLLEALVNDRDGIAAQILEQLGVLGAVRRELASLFELLSHESIQSLLMTDPALPRTEGGHPYQVVFKTDGTSGQQNLVRGPNNEPQVAVLGPHAQPDQHVVLKPAPPVIAEAAEEWEAQQIR